LATQSLSQKRYLNLWPHTVAILIGGQSTRMGTPKHLVTLPTRKTMVETMIEFAEKTASNTVVVGGTIQGATCIPDLRSSKGPVAGIEALLDSGLDSEYLIVGCDMPLLQPEHIEKLLVGEDNTIFTHSGSLLGLPIRLFANTLQSCTEYLQEKKSSIRGFVKSVPHCVVTLPPTYVPFVTSLNTKNEITGAFSK
jgi:molybdopterin-guanine dinucleotide biosynthesis protein A